MVGKFWHIWVVDESDGLFECYDCNDSFDPFFVRVNYNYKESVKDVMERACVIAEHELELWMGGYNDLENEGQKQYYESMSVGEVVMNALDFVEIDYDIYFKHERKDA